MNHYHTVLAIGLLDKRSYSGTLASCLPGHRDCISMTRVLGENIEATHPNDTHCVRARTHTHTHMPLFVLFEYKRVVETQQQISIYR